MTFLSKLGWSFEGVQPGAPGVVLFLAVVPGFGIGWMTRDEIEEEAREEGWGGVIGG